MIVVAAILRDTRGRCFVGERAHGAYAGTWEFPGGKVEPGESDFLALLRELIEEGIVDGAGVSVGASPVYSAQLQLASGAPFTIRHYLTHAPRVNQHPPLEGASHRAFRWVSWEDLRGLPVGSLSPGMAAILASLPYGVV